MPYIKNELRQAIRRGAQPLSAGELAFQLADAVNSYLTTFDVCVHYSAYAEVIGVLETLKMEVYRVLVGPLEDRKMIENGIVFDGQAGTRNEE